MSETRQRTVQFLANLGVTDASLPLDLSTISLSPHEIMSFFSEGNYHILGLNVVVLSEEKKLILPANITSGLVTLNVDGNQHLTNLDVIGQCTNLHNLNISHVNEVKDYSFLTKLTQLRTLHFTQSRNLQVEDVFLTLPELTTLDLSSTGLEGKLEFKAPKLRSLTLNNTNLTSTNFLNGTPNLQHLKLRKCVRLTTLNGIQTCENLRSLDATDCLLLENISVIANCSKLITLKLKGCSELSDMLALHSTPLLRHLELNSVDTMTNMPPLRHFPNLHTLDVGYCGRLTFMVGVANLKVLKLDNMESLEELAPLPQLRRLKLNNILLIINLAKLQDIPNLRKLSIFNCPRLVTLRGISVCAVLNRLKIHSCPALENLDGTESCFNLENLDLIKCNIRDLKGPVQCYNMYISECINLVGLNLDDQWEQLLSLIVEKCPVLVDLSSLQQCTNLAVLQVRECFQLEKIPHLRHTKVSELMVENCPKVSSIDSSPRLEIVEIVNIGATSIDCINKVNAVLYLRTNCTFKGVILTKVTKLDLSNHNNEDLAFLSKCTNLRELKLNAYSRLTSLRGIPASCVSVELIDCAALTSLQGLGVCKDLHYLNVMNCPSLGDIYASAQLPLLYTIFVDVCPLLSKEEVLLKLQTYDPAWTREGSDFLRLE